MLALRQWYNELLPIFRVVVNKLESAFLTTQNSGSCVPERPILRTANGRYDGIDPVRQSDFDLILLSV